MKRQAKATKVHPSSFTSVSQGLQMFDMPASGLAPDGHARALRKFVKKVKKKQANLNAF
jgi:hypothetical protein